MNGQMSLFEFIEDPDREKKDRAKAWSAGRQMADGFRDGIREKNRKELQETENEHKTELRSPCNRRCPVECFSKECYIRRGYIWAPEQQRGNWLRNEDGRIVIGPKQCDWIPVDGPRISATFECFAEYRTEAGGVRSGECEKGYNDPEKPKPCSGCPVNNEFYRIAHEYNEQGKTWGEAVALTVDKLGLANVPEYMPDAYRNGLKYDEALGEWIPKNWRNDPGEA